MYPEDNSASRSSSSVSCSISSEPSSEMKEHLKNVSTHEIARKWAKPRSSEAERVQRSEMTGDTPESGELELLLARLVLQVLLADEEGKP